LKRLLPIFGAFVALSCGRALEPSGTRLVWQTVQEYFIHRDQAQQIAAGTKRLNSFTTYTHIGTDFGFHGPAEHEIVWLSDEIVVNLSQQPDAWAGMWHSLAGRAASPLEVMDFTRPYPPEIAAHLQPRVSAVMIEAAGRGRFKIEIKSAAGEVRWTQLIDVVGGSYGMFVRPVDPETLRDAKTIIWTVEPGSDVKISGLWLGMERPQIGFDAQAFLASYAKLLRCYSAETGYVRDRAHIEAGAFDTVSATGIFVLATAAASQQDVGLVTANYARNVLRQTHAAVGRLKTAHGLLPHFVRRQDGVTQIHPGTEYSTVDSAIYVHSMLLAAIMLGEQAIADEVVAIVKRMDFPRMRLPGGHLSHGFLDDGVTLLRNGWQDWGGETALVILMERIADPGCLPPRMRRPGHAWQGAGFITELQSLFHPDFDSDEPDAHDGVRWLSVRRDMLAAQRAYMSEHWPASAAAREGLYGLSAGENRFGNGYWVGGVDLPSQDLIHPHYILMSAALRSPAEDVAELIRRMEKSGLFPPWGMVENVTFDCKSYLPMEGGLNAGFEALGAYHFLTKARGLPDAVYEASHRSPHLRQAMRLFYPGTSGQDAGQ
jgi:hypothetical protein